MSRTKFTDTEIRDVAIRQGRQAAARRHHQKVATIARIARANRG